MLRSTFRILSNTAVIRPSAMSLAGSARTFAAPTTIELIKKLREKTGAPMNDCKKAIEAESGDLEKAVDWLRKKGVLAAAKKSGRATTDGLVGVAISADHLDAVAVEVNSETDFVARNTLFQALVGKIANAALTTPNPTDIEALKTHKIAEDNLTVSDSIASVIGSVGENVQLRRASSLSLRSPAPAPGSYANISSYVHNSLSPTLGKIAAIVGLRASPKEGTQLSDESRALLDKFGFDVCMHIAAARPLFLNRESVDPVALQRERDIVMEQVKEKGQGKAEHIIAKMIEGRLTKFYEDVVLVEQKLLVGDGDKKINKVIEEIEKKIAGKVELAGFIRLQCGEGAEEKKEEQPQQ